MTLGQMLVGQLQSVHPDTLKDVLLILTALVSVTASVIASVVNITGSRRRQQREVSFSQAFVEAQLFQEKCAAIEKRLDTHDESIDQIWQVVRSENTAIRRELQEAVSTILKALGRLEGLLDGERKK